MADYEVNSKDVVSVSNDEHAETTQIIHPILVPPAVIDMDLEDDDDYNYYCDDDDQDDDDDYCSSRECPVNYVDLVIDTRQYRSRLNLGCVEYLDLVGTTVRVSLMNREKCIKVLDVDGEDVIAHDVTAGTYPRLESFAERLWVKYSYSNESSCSSRAPQKKMIDSGEDGAVNNCNKMQIELLDYGIPMWLSPHPRLPSDAPTNPSLQRGISMTPPPCSEYHAPSSFTSKVPPSRLDDRPLQLLSSAASAASVASVASVAVRQRRADGTASASPPHHHPHDNKRKRR